MRYRRKTCCSAQGGARPPIGRKGRRGVTLIVVILLVAVLAMMGMSLIRLIQMDLTLVGQSSRNLEAREIAEGGVNEVINDIALPASLPDLDSANLCSNYVVPPGRVSPFLGQNRSYGATIGLMRIAPLPESSHGHARAMVYEIGVVSQYRGGVSTADIRAEVYRPIARDPGVLLPDKHCR